MPEELDREAVDTIRDAALHAARIGASARLLASLETAGMRAAMTPESVTAAMRDSSDPRAAVLKPYRLAWFLDVVKLLAEALPHRGSRAASPDVVATADALAAGATWAQIGEATGTAATSAHDRYHRRRPE